VDRALLTPAVLVAAFGLVCSLHAGWRRTLALVPALVLGTVVGAATAGTPAWPWLVAALGMLVGLAARVGWAVPAVVAAFITVGVPPQPDGATWTRPAVVAVVGLYAVVVAGVLKLPATVPGRRLPWPVSLVVAVVCAAAAGLAGVLAQASGNPFGSWAPATLFLLVLPSTELSLPRRAAHRVVGTLVGAAPALALASLPVPQILLAGAALYLCLVLTRPVWVSTLLSTVAVVLLLQSSTGADVAAGTRLAAVGTAAVIAVAAAAVLATVGRFVPAAAVRAADTASRDVRLAPAG